MRIKNVCAQLSRINFYPIRRYIYRINSTMSIKKFMWLCTMRRDNLTNQRTDLIAQHLKRCFGPSEVIKVSYFCIIVLHNFISEQQASASKNSDRIYCVLSARSEAQVIYNRLYENYYFLWLFLVILSSSLSGSDDFVLFDSLNGNGA